ncbi:MAG: DNA mismatch repair protein MutS [Thermicanus sp.]|nr:DNA mismatch repair protein MutS [Thermicanus sp.]
MEQVTPMMRQYLDIKKEHADALLFFRLGDFYELFFEDALVASRELEITLTGREGGGERIPMCGVPHHSADAYIKILIDRGYKVAICEQMEDPKLAKGVVKREVVRVITPGTLIDQELLDSENHYLAALVKIDGEYGLAFSDLSTGEFYLPSSPFFSRLSLLEELLPYAPKELLYEPGMDEEDLSYLLEALKTMATPYALQEENSFHRFFPGRGEGLSLPSRRAASLLLSYLEATQKRSISHVRRLEIYPPDRHMILDPFTRRNLELTETIRNGSKEGSLLHAIDRTVTSMGRRGLKRWLDKPLLDREEIEARLDAVQYFYDHPIIRADIRETLKEVYDLERLVGRISYGNVNGRDLAQLRRTLGVLPHLLSPFTDGEESQVPELLRFQGEMTTLLTLHGLLEKALVDDPPVSVKEGGLIREGFNQDLDRYRDAGRNGKAWIAALEQKERDRTGIRSLKVGFNKVFGYYIEVTKANLSLVPPEYERKQTLAGGERYVTPELREKEQLILEAEEKMVELEYRLFQEIREILLAHIEELQEVAACVVRLDLFSSLAQLAEERNYCRPRSHGERRLKILEGRHPVIEQVLKEPYIPNDTFFDEERRIYLITGPNMAGKSTYMRQVALIQLLFQIGSFVPAREAELPVVDRIFTRIGAADDLVEGSSTFMVEMNEIMVTTTQATAKSLVIIDELGRGTSTQDGMAIAQAVIEYLHDQVKCLTLVSTHFHELAALEATLHSLRNYHMAVKEKKEEILFTRQLVAGSTSNSYGIYCAYLAGIPKRIIARANELLSTYEEKSIALQLTFPFLEEGGETSGSGADPREKEENVEQREPVQSVDHTNRREQTILQELKTLDLNRLPPIEALMLLSRWQGILNQGEGGEEEREVKEGSGIREGKK